MSGPTFIKMHGLGNDFVVLDLRARALEVNGAEARAIADRRLGVGCDQVITIEPPATDLADASMRIYNPDGSEAEACGNGARCVAALLMREAGSDHVVIETAAGMLDADARKDGLISVDMGPARTEWRDIPLAEATDTLHLGISSGPLADPVGVGMGNPHAVFFVDDVAKVDLAKHGPKLEHHKIFPARANISVAQIVSEKEIRLRVWERGAGITPACGSAACAALVAAQRRGLAGRQAAIVLDGGRLDITWQEDGHVLMTGPVAVSFTGELDEHLLARHD